MNDFHTQFIMDLSKHNKLQPTVENLFNGKYPGQAFFKNPNKGR